MKFVRSSFIAWRISKVQVFFDFFLITLLSIYLIGCSDRVRLPSAGQLAEFQDAGPVPLSVDMDRLARAKISTGAYRVVPDDVLELTMPTVLGVVTAESSNIVREGEEITLYVCRVSESGTITLPIIGEIKVVGKTLAEIESSIVHAYYPKYAVNRPSVYVRVLEYKTAKVSISGAVKEPGLYELRNDNMSLVALLMKAGGIIEEGATLIRITHSDRTVASAVHAPRQKAQKTLEKITEYQPKQTIMAVPSAHYPVSNEGPCFAGSHIEVQLTFKQITPSSTTGQLSIIKDDGTPLLTEQLDITSEIEMQALLKRLARKDSRVSTFKVKQRLYALAELLKPGFGIHNAGGETTYENMNRSAGLNTAQIPLAGGFADENINPNTEPNWSDSEQDSTVDEALYQQLVAKYQELIDTVGQEKKSENGEKAEFSQPNKSFVLPVKGYNIPFADVALHDGDSVVVERLALPLITVIGLVNNPGNFEYPPNVQYNLMQALGFAGGLNLVAEPRYATVYRLKPDGGIVSAIFKIADGSKLTEDVSTLIKPGDIVDVAHTHRTRTKLFLDKVFRINLGTYLRLEDAWD